MPGQESIFDFGEHVCQGLEFRLTWHAWNTQWTNSASEHDRIIKLCIKREELNTLCAES